MDFLKAEQLTTSKWRVLAIPFGGPYKDDKDWDGEFFSKNTDIKPDWFDRRPAVWHHNFDKSMDADSTIGTSDDLEEQDDGWWSTVWLNRTHRYWAEVDKRLREGKIFGSSGTMPNFVKTDKKTGEILVWPYVEQTLTPTPSNFLSRLSPIKAVDHFDAAGIGLSPAVRGLLSDLDGPTADLPTDLPTGGDVAAIQRPVSDPKREAAIRKLVALNPRLGELIK